MPVSAEGPLVYDGLGEQASAERVAAMLARFGAINAASDALNNIGWQSTVAGNRITVDNRIFARFFEDPPGPARWVVYGIGDQPPVHIVDAAAPGKTSDDTLGGDFR